MPYILAEVKADLDLYGDEPGVLTYKLQQVIEDFLLKRGLSYESIALVLGSIGGLESDFNRRVVIPYEERKQRENGDVWHPSLTQ